MDKTEKVLAAIDLSTYSPKVLEYALHLARICSAKLVIANVINLRNIEPLSSLQNLNITKDSMNKYIENEKTYRKQKILELLDNINHNDVNIEIVFEGGIPYQSLIHIISEQHIDMLVMANKGRSNLANVLFGTTAEKMFRHSPIPILSIRNFNKEDYRKH